MFLLGCTAKKLYTPTPSLKHPDPAHASTPSAMVYFWPSAEWNLTSFVVSNFALQHEIAHNSFPVFALQERNSVNESDIRHKLRNPLKRRILGRSLDTQLQLLGCGWDVGSRRRTRLEPCLG